jgi:hypothetical protein
LNLCDEAESIDKEKGIHLYSINGELKFPILKFGVNEFWSNKFHVVDFVPIKIPCGRDLYYRLFRFGFYVSNNITCKIKFTSSND